MSSRVIISLKHRPKGLQLNGAHIRTIDPDPCRGHPFGDHGGHPARLPGDEIRVPILYEDEDVLVYN